jgi:hypothetical protein
MIAKFFRAPTALRRWFDRNHARERELLVGFRKVGSKAFEARKGNKSGIYSYERRGDALDEPYARVLRANRAAARLFAAQAPYYRRAACWWIVSAKKEETRLKRLARLIQNSAHGTTVPAFTRAKVSR